MLSIPQDVALILRLLRQAGHLAYVVGGCVRDALLGRTPKDWDICTSATPEEMQRIFSGYHMVETGLKHGTLTVGKPWPVIKAFIPKLGKTKMVPTR